MQNIQLYILIFTRSLSSNALLICQSYLIPYEVREVPLVLLSAFIEAAVVERGDVGGHQRCVALDLQIADKRPGTNLPPKRLTHEYPKMCHQNTGKRVDYFCNNSEKTR